MKQGSRIPERRAPVQQAQSRRAGASSRAQQRYGGGDTDFRRVDLRIADDGTVTIVPNGHGHAFWGGNEYEIFDPAAYAMKVAIESNRFDRTQKHHVGPLAEVLEGHQLLISEVTEQALVTEISQGMTPQRLGWRKAFGYAARAGWGPMDFSQAFGGEANRLMAWNGVLYDRYDFGNLMWGAGMCALRLGKLTAHLAAHYNALRNHNEFDTKSDQRAIARGYRWARRLALHKIIWPPDGRGDNALSLDEEAKRE